MKLIIACKFTKINNSCEKIWIKKSLLRFWNFCQCFHSQQLAMAASDEAIVFKSFLEASRYGHLKLIWKTTALRKFKKFPIENFLIKFKTLTLKF